MLSARLLSRKAARQCACRATRLAPVDAARPLTTHLPTSPLSGPSSPVREAAPWRSEEAASVAAWQGFGNMYRTWYSTRQSLPGGSRRLMSTQADQGQSMEFQAETRQLLDIVTHSIYTDKEVFLRELVSNASDAIEKLRHLQVTNQNVINAAAPLEINIQVDKTRKIITLEDSGIGMTKDELISNLGTIARSGSKAFMKELNDRGEKVEGEAALGIIGQFGVGFYSAFMVGKDVTVYSRSARDGSATFWRSEGTGQYTVGPADDSDAPVRGTKIVINMREGCEEFADMEKVKEIIQKYSNFVSVPIKVHGKVVNTVSAIWTKAPSEIKPEQYEEFYRFVTGGYDTPRYTLHYRVDVPLDLKVLLYVPIGHAEKSGFGRMPPGVNIYSRKVLIQEKAKDILPEWMRFLKGVVDSEDLPLSLSREKPQDSRLLAKIKDVLTRRVLRFFADQAKNDLEKYKDFYKEFGVFLKEGICQDHMWQPGLAKLLYFETSKNQSGELTSLDEYIARCPPEQKEIYYLCAPSRALAEQSPYYEVFKRSKKEVLFVYNSLDDFCMANLRNYNKRDIVSIESDKIQDDLSKADDAEEEQQEELSEAEAKELCDWLNTALPNKLKKVGTTRRLADSPAIVSSHESGAVRKMNRMLEYQNTGHEPPLPKQNLEINPRHSVITGLNRLRTAEPDLAQMIAEQVFDNALVAAGLLDDGRAMLPRMNKLMERVIKGGQISPALGAEQSLNVPKADKGSEVEIPEAGQHSTSS